MSKEAYLMRFVPSPLWMLAFLLALPATLCAQKPRGSWEVLSRLKAGQEIEVVESNLKSHKGHFVAIADDSLTFQEGGSSVSVRRGDVARVSASSKTRSKHALRGLLIGGVTLGAIGAITERIGAGGGPLYFHGAGGLVGFALGAPTGAAIAAALPADTTIYRAEPAAPLHQTASPQTE